MDSTGGVGGGDMMGLGGGGGVMGEEGMGKERGRGLFKGEVTKRRRTPPCKRLHHLRELAAIQR